MVLRNFFNDTGKFAGSGHITFVYGKNSDGKIIGLGGNQKQTIRFSRYAMTGSTSKFRLNNRTLQQRFHGFYIPATYAEFAAIQAEVGTFDVAELNSKLLAIGASSSAINESTR